MRNLIHVLIQVPHERFALNPIIPPSGLITQKSSWFHPHYSPCCIIIWLSLAVERRMEGECMNWIGKRRWEDRVKTRDFMRDPGGNWCNYREVDLLLSLREWFSRFLILWRSSSFRCGLLSDGKEGDEQVPLEVSQVQVHYKHSHCCQAGTFSIFIIYEL